MPPIVPPDPGQQEIAKKMLPPGDGRDALIGICSGCHLFTVITSQRKSESLWTDTIVLMRSRGAAGTDEDLASIVEYLTKNFGPDSPPPQVNVNIALATDMVNGLGLTAAEAQAVVDYRTKNGSFKDLAALKQVPGLDAGKIDGLKDRIEF